MIRQTSMMAYQEISHDGTIGKQAYEILLFFKENYPITFSRNEISRKLDITINAVCGRINELIKAEWLIETGKEYDPITKKKNMTIIYKQSQII